MIATLKYNYYCGFSSKETPYKTLNDTVPGMIVTYNWTSKGPPKVEQYEEQLKTHVALGQNKAIIDQKSVA